MGAEEMGALLAALTGKDAIIQVPALWRSVAQSILGRKHSVVLIGNRESHWIAWDGEGRLYDPEFAAPAGIPQYARRNWLVLRIVRLT